MRCVAPEGATLLLSYSRFLRLSRGQSMGTTAVGEKRHRAIDRATHRQRRALGDRKQRTEKDAQRLKRDLEP